MVRLPSLLACDCMYSMSSTPLICSSTGDATVSAITFGLAPGYCACTITDGGTTSGYSEIGKTRSASSPDTRMISDSTPAKIGRSMKNLGRFMFGLLGNIEVKAWCRGAMSYRGAGEQSQRNEHLRLFVACTPQDDAARCQDCAAPPWRACVSG